MTAGLMGPAVMTAAMILALAAVILGRRWALIASAAAAAVATLLLGWALLAPDFSLQYVAETTSLSTPWPYRIAGVWGGMNGSMLFYTTLLLIVAAFGLVSAMRVRLGAIVGLGLLGITMIFANPFEVLALPAVDGQGLLAILQHPAMIYHPPILYFGLVTSLVPFAISLTHDESSRGESLRAVRKWFYLSWTLLTFGMAFGANWAYVELGWGGFWAWDPVENTSLMPWLAMTVFLHTSRVEETTGRLRRWNSLFAGLPFALSLMGVYLTRSGATGSIHSFAEDPVVGRVLLAATVVALALVLVGSGRGARGEPWGEIEVDRDLLLVANASLLSIILVFVVAGSAYPAFASVFGGRPTIVDPRFFVTTVLPLAIVVAIGLAVALRARWVALGGALLGVGVGVLIVTQPRPGALLLVPAGASFAVIVVMTLRRRPRGRLLVAHLAHMGMALLLVGVGGSALGDEFRGSMTVGDKVDVGGHEVTLVGIETGEAERFVFVRATFDVDGKRVESEIRAYEDQPAPVSEPVLRSTAIDDVIVAISLLFPDRETVAVSLFVRPLVWWVWAGTALMGLGGLLALGGRAGGAEMPRRSARAERQPGETTSGRTSP